MDFRSRLLATLRRVAGVAATLVVSQDVDIGVPVTRHAAVKARLAQIEGLRPSAEEPSVWLPDSPELLEVNFLGMDAATRGPDDTYVYEDPELPLMVFGLLSLLRPGGRVEAAELAVPVPRLAGLLLEKLATERTGEKGDRDLLVAMGLLLVAGDADLVEAREQYCSLAAELRHNMRANLTALSLLEPRADMPDPRRHRHLVASFLEGLERREEAPA